MFCCSASIYSAVYDLVACRIVDILNSRLHFVLDLSGPVFKEVNDEFNKYETKGFVQATSVINYKTCNSRELDLLKFAGTNPNFKDFKSYSESLKQQIYF